ncbi:MAG: hypothetical protein AAFR21_12650 [Pseudomonadota bacterium]
MAKWISQFAIAMSLVAAVTTLSFAGPSMASSDAVPLPSEVIPRVAGGEGLIDGDLFAGIDADAVYFTPGFFDPAADDFWSYVMIWRANTDITKSPSDIGLMLTEYYNKLAKAKVTRVLTGADPNAPDRAVFAITTLDPFVTKGPIALNVRMSRVACPSGSADFVFVLSPSRPLLKKDGALMALAEKAACTEWPDKTADEATGAADNVTQD